MDKDGESWLSSHFVAGQNSTYTNDHLDRIQTTGSKLLFGMKAYSGLVETSENVANQQWKRLPQSLKYDQRTLDRDRPQNSKEQIVDSREEFVDAALRITELINPAVGDKNVL